MNNKLIERIRGELAKPLPGKTFQELMAPESRKMFENSISGNTKKSSILLPMYMNKKEYYTILFQRQDYEGAHSGQICFPGGKKEPEDKDLKETAIRETWEEVGIEKEKVNILGALTPLHIPVSDYLVYPYVAYTSYNPVFKIDPLEVKQLIVFPIKEILNKRNQKKKAMNIHGLEHIIPYYSIEGFEIWGATAMILSEWSELLRRINFPHID